jgi:hypothetical protein
LKVPPTSCLLAGHPRTKILFIEQHFYTKGFCPLWPMEEDTFYQQVTRSCQSLLVCVKNLGVGVQEGSEEGVVQGIQQTAAAVMALTDVLQDQAERLGDQPSFHQVKVLVEETRLYVLSFIRQSKKVFANPLDYLTLQEFDVTKRMVCTRHAWLLIPTGF